MKRTREDGEGATHNHQQDPENEKVSSNNQHDDGQAFERQNEEHEKEQEKAPKKNRTRTSFITRLVPCAAQITTIQLNTLHN